jgi:DNA-binding transcriptional MerR regulator
MLGKRGFTMLYTVGEMAKKFNVAPSTLRYYDKEGLLPFLERSSGGIRMFKEDDMGWLTIIDCLKQIGMPIKNIKEFVNWCMEGDSTIEQRLDLIDTQSDAVQKQIKDLQEMLHILEYKHWYYETAKQAGTCDVHNTMPLKDIPEEFHDIVQKSNGIDKI